MPRHKVRGRKTLITNVEEIELRAVTVPYLRKIVWATGSQAETRYMVLALRDGQGQLGMAECPVNPAWNGFDTDTFALAFEDQVVPMLWRAREGGLPVDEVLDKFPDNSALRALLDNALWDLASASDGPPSDEPVPVSATITRGAPSDMAAEAGSLVERHGFSTLKVKGGQDVPTDIAAVRLIQQAVGDSVALYVDANQAFSADDAGDYVARLAELGVVAVEDPYALTPDQRLADIHTASGIPLIVDTNLDGISGVRQFLGSGCEGFSLKPSRFGLRNVEAMGAVVADARALAVVGLYSETYAGVIHLLAAHTLLSGRTRLLPAEATAPLILADHYLTAPLSVVDGHITPPPVANLAEMVDPDRLDRLTVGPVKRWTRSGSMSAEAAK